jgi:hypothetical protein
MKKTFFFIFLSALMLITFSCNKMAQDEQPTPEKTQRNAKNGRSSLNANNLAKNVDFIRLVSECQMNALEVKNYFKTKTKADLQTSVSFFNDATINFTTLDFASALGYTESQYNAKNATMDKLWQNIFTEFPDLLNVSEQEFKRICSAGFDGVIGDPNIIVEEGCRESYDIAIAFVTVKYCSTNNATCKAAKALCMATYIACELGSMF